MNSGVGAYNECMRGHLTISARKGARADGRWRYFVRRILLVGWVALLVMGMAGPLARYAAAQEQGGPHALVISIDGVINPVKDRYLERALEEAGESGAALLVITLDTPGGC